MYVANLSKITYMYAVIVREKIEAYPYIYRIKEINRHVNKNLKICAISHMFADELYVIYAIFLFVIRLTPIKNRMLYFVLNVTYAHFFAI